MTPRLSVVVRTRHARPASLAQVLDALRSQSLDRAAWELLLVENAATSRSDPSLSWHASAQRLLEPTRGKLPTLLRGLAGARGEVVVIVDDDNVLADNYLEEVDSLFSRSDWIGAANGHVAGEFAEPPPPWTPLFEADLALWDLGSKQKAVLLPAHGGLPAYGAGLAVRRQVFAAFLEAHARDPRRRLFGPSGFDAGEDLDLAYHAFAVGLSRAYVPTLRLRHLIPQERLGSRALLDLARVNACAFEYARLLHAPASPAPAPAWGARVAEILDLPRGGMLLWRRRRALRAGRRDARGLLALQPHDPASEPPVQG